MSAMDWREHLDYEEHRAERLAREEAIRECMADGLTREQAEQVCPA